MKNALLIGILILFAAVNLSAIQIDGTDVTCEDLGRFGEDFIGAEIPSSIPYRNEIFNIYVLDKNFGHLEIEEGKVKSLSCGESEGATYEIRVNNENLFEDAENFSSTIDFINNKLSDKDLEIEGLSFGKKIKWFFTSLALRILGIFS